MGRKAASRGADREDASKSRRGQDRGDSREKPSQGVRRKSPLKLSAREAEADSKHDKDLDDLRLTLGKGQQLEVKAKPFVLKLEPAPIAQKEGKKGKKDKKVKKV